MDKEADEPMNKEEGETKPHVSYKNTLKRDKKECKIKSHLTLMHKDIKPHITCDHIDTLNSPDDPSAKRMKLNELPFAEKYIIEEDEELFEVLSLFISFFPMGNLSTLQPRDLFNSIVSAIPNPVKEQLGHFPGTVSKCIMNKVITNIKHDLSLITTKDRPGTSGFNVFKDVNEETLNISPITFIKTRIISELVYLMYLTNESDSSSDSEHSQYSDHEEAIDFLALSTNMYNKDTWIKLLYLPISDERVLDLCLQLHLPKPFDILRTLLPNSVIRLTERVLEFGRLEIKLYVDDDCVIMKCVSEENGVEKIAQKFLEKLDLGSLPYGSFLLSVKANDPVEVQRINSLLDEETNGNEE